MWQAFSAKGRMMVKEEDALSSDAGRRLCKYGEIRIGENMMKLS